MERNPEILLDQRHAQSLEELYELLRIPSISMEAEYANHVERAAGWVADRLRAAGIEHVKECSTTQLPVVYGDWLHAPGKPTLLIYGHFDVQPVDPLDSWNSPPFEPQIRDGRLYARGASDMKGNLLESILGVEALLQTGALGVNVKFLLEGAEEIGSPGLASFIAENTDLLACDLVVSADGSQWGEDQPRLVLGMRGCVDMQIDMTGPPHDVHSGTFGGLIANPLQALVHVLESMYDDSGAVAIEGFYDDVASLSTADRAALARVPFDEKKYMAATGVTEFITEPGYGELETLWTRPRLEIVGMWGGFQGEGIKTIIPSAAHVKLSCRLVPNQAPSRIADLIRDHVARNIPAGVAADVQVQEGMAEAYLLPRDHWGNSVAAEALTEMYGAQPYYTRIGATVPICEMFFHHLGVYTVTYGFGLEDEQPHAPNEFLRLSSFKRGQRAWVALLLRMGTLDVNELPGPGLRAQ